MRAMAMDRKPIAFLIVLSMILAGCLGEVDTLEKNSIPWDNDFVYIETPESHQDSRDFVV
ncbi:MAG: hypothetical protein ACI9EM_000536, partial [Candidatus Thalassarchaeaceae archaeon]